MVQELAGEAVAAQEDQREVEVDIGEKPLDSEGIRGEEGAEGLEEEGSGVEEEQFIPVPDSLDIAVDDDEAMQKHRHSRVDAQKKKGMERMERGSRGWEEKRWKSSPLRSPRRKNRPHLCRSTRQWSGVSMRVELYNVETGDNEGLCSILNLTPPRALIDDLILCVAYHTSTSSSLLNPPEHLLSCWRHCCFYYIGRSVRADPLSRPGFQGRATTPFCEPNDPNLACALLLKSTLSSTTTSTQHNTDTTEQ